MKREYFEKVNPSHPDKIADRIAGAVVDLGYKLSDYPKVAVEVMMGHGECFVVAETTEPIKIKDIEKAIDRISPEPVKKIVRVYPQDKHLTNNQDGKIRAGDNGIFKGLPVTKTENKLSQFAQRFYDHYPTDGKHILDTKDGGRLVVSQSHLHLDQMNDYAKEIIEGVEADQVDINQLGFWTGGTSVDVGCTNRKLGSDMAQAVTGGGLHGKDLSKADVTLNIYAHLLAQEKGEEVLISCAIGDEYIGGVPYAEIVEIARDYINNLGGFEKFAEWGLI